MYGPVTDAKCFELALTLKLNKNRNSVILDIGNYIRTQIAICIFFCICNVFVK